MNLLDIRTKEWNSDLLDAAGEGLSEKLGSPLSPNTVVGHVSEYMQERSVKKLVFSSSGKHSSIHSKNRYLGPCASQTSSFNVH